MITRNSDATHFISAALYSHAEAWDKAIGRENYILGRDLPFNDDELQENANWCSNYNFGMGVAVTDSVVRDNVTEILRALDFNEINFVAFDKRVHKTEVSAFLQYEEMRHSIAERLQYAFGNFISKDPGFCTMVCKSEYQIFLFGYAAHVEDIRNYLPKVMRFTEIAFEDHTPIDNIGRFASFDLIKGDYLLNILESLENEDDDVILCEEDSTHICSNGWNKKLLNQVVCRIFTSNEECQGLLRERANLTKENETIIQCMNWEDINFLIQGKGRVWAAQNLNNIYIGRIYEPCGSGVVENHVLLCGDPQNMSSVSSANSEGIVYHRYHKDKSYDEIIVMVRDFAVMNSEYIHEIEGASRMLARHALRYDIRRNELDNQNLMGGSVWLEASDPYSKLDRAVDLTVKGGIIQVGDSVKPSQFQPEINLSHAANGVQMEKMEFAELFSSYRPNVKLSNRPNKDEVQMAQAQINAVKTGDIPIKLNLYSKVLTNCFRRLSSGRFMSKSLNQYRKRFIECVRAEFQGEVDLTDENIKELLSLVQDVKISPVHTDPQMLAQAITSATSSAARKRFTRMLMRAYGFSSSEIRGMMEIEDYGREAEIAALENAAFETTSEVAFSRAQDHVTHLNAHYYKVDRKFNGVRNGEDPVAAMNYARNALLNTSMHLEAVKASVYLRKYASDFEKMQNQLEAALSQLAAQVQRMVQQQQEQGGQQQGQMQISPELQRKFYEDQIKLENKLKTANIRTQHAQQLAEQRQAFNMRLKEQQAQHEAALREKKTEAEVNSTVVKSAAKMLA